MHPAAPTLKPPAVQVKTPNHAGRAGAWCSCWCHLTQTYPSRTIAHYINCSGVAPGMWQRAYSIHLVLQCPRFKSDWATGDIHGHHVGLQRAGEGLSGKCLASFNGSRILGQYIWVWLCRSSTSPNHCTCYDARWLTDAWLANESYGLYIDLMPTQSKKPGIKLNIVQNAPLMNCILHCMSLGVKGDALHSNSHKHISWKTAFTAQRPRKGAGLWNKHPTLW